MMSERGLSLWPLEVAFAKGEDKPIKSKSAQKLFLEGYEIDLFRYQKVEKFLQSHNCSYEKFYSFLGPHNRLMKHKFLMLEQLADKKRFGQVRIQTNNS